MSKALRVSLIVIGAFVISGALLLTGFLIGRSAWGMPGFWRGDMMGLQSRYGSVPSMAQSHYGLMGPGMMSGYGGTGMMGDRDGEQSMMDDNMMEGDMMDDTRQNSGEAQDIPAQMPISPERAAEIAQGYLDSYFPGDQADDHADAFYGYYTLHVLRDGDVVGMLSVNGFTGQVFPHTWHGDFVEMSPEA